MWKDSIYAENIYKHYKEKNNLKKVYAIELIENNSLCKKVISLMSTEIEHSKNNDLYMKLNFLEARPDMKHKDSKTRTIKGAGELGMYGLAKLAISSCVKSLNFEHTPNSYKLYNKLNIPSFEKYRFWEQDEMKNFIKSTEKKYNF